MALKIMEQYKDHPQCCNQDKVLPVLSNQKMNAYLKEIADVCGINKNLTFHKSVMRVNKPVNRNLLFFE